MMSTDATVRFADCDRAIVPRTTSNTSRPRYLALGCVVALHVALFWTLSAILLPVALVETERELQVTVFYPRIASAQPPAPPLGWMFQMPEVVLVPEPEIVLTPEARSSGGIAAGIMSARLVSSLDPSHVNERPQLPATLGSMIAALTLRLRLLVLPDGSVFDAKVEKSTGEAEIDQLAIGWIRAEWRYLPAMVNGRPITAWTTVIVRFAAIH